MADAEDAVHVVEITPQQDFQTSYSYMKYDLMNMIEIFTKYFELYQKYLLHDPNAVLIYTHVDPNHKLFDHTDILISVSTRYMRESDDPANWTPFVMRETSKFNYITLESHHFCDLTYITCMYCGLIVDSNDLVFSTYHLIPYYVNMTRSLKLCPLCMVYSCIEEKMKLPAPYLGDVHGYKINSELTFEENYIASVRSRRGYYELMKDNLKLYLYGRQILMIVMGMRRRGDIRLPVEIYQFIYNEFI